MKSSEARSPKPEARQLVEGWLFDVYPSSSGMVLWLIDRDGRPHRVRYPYAPSMYVSGDRHARGVVEAALQPLAIRLSTSRAVRKELMSGEEIDVLRIAVHNPLAYPAVARRLARVPGLTLYNCDIPVARLFLYESGLFPLVRCAVSCDGDVAREIALESRSDDLEYELPPFVVLRLRFDHETGTDGANPMHGRRGRIEAGVDGETVVLDGDDPAESVRSLNRLIERYDPDVLLTEWGDEVLMPGLRALAARAGIPLALNRDPTAGVRLRRSRSYMTYGKVVFQGGAQMLHGRWHLDLRNSFIYGESELAGLLDVARLARIPVQELARTSTGTAISSMQLNQAIADGVLIPWQKSEPEAFKTASQLLLTDKGGLTYQPIVGLFEGVGELDFSSMYPTMMARFNISPETVGCTCCPDSQVPEIGYTICRKRRGLVPRVLDHLLERRMYYKQRKQETSGDERAMYDQRQTALKWCLVTCLDGETLVPVKQDDRIQVKPIREIIDSYLPEGPGVLPVQNLRVFGYDEHLHPVENPVRNVIKAPAPPKLLRLKLQSGRELRMVPNHRCFVLENDRLVVKYASELREGDLIPVASSLPYQTQATRTLNLIEELFRHLPDDEKPLWRVFGRTLKKSITDKYDLIRRKAKKVYTDKTIWNWREYDYIPLQFLPCLDLREEDFSGLSMGRGKREGGLIQRVPALLKLDQDLGFLLGFFIGDGSGKKTFMTFLVHANELDVARKLSRILSEKFHLPTTLRKERKANMYVLQVNSVALVRIFETVLRVGGNARNGKIDIPSLLWGASDDIIYGFISGLIASDGCIGKKETFLRVSSARKAFLDKLGILLIQRGIPHRYYSHGHSMYALEIVKEGVHAVRSNGWLSKKHDAILKRRLHREAFQRRLSRRVITHGPFRCLPIRSIEPIPSKSQYVYCFEVERKLDGFIVSGGIFTANSFGYLGYRNARFGRIEAHEATTAFAREMLLQAKEVAEARGYRMLHALVDSMWLQRAGATRDDYEALAHEVTTATGLQIFVEGVYRWIGFLPSKTHRGVGVPNRYMGVFEDNSTKVRGIEVRRSDVPILVEEMQERMLHRMFHCATLDELKAALPEVLAILEETLVRLRAGEVTAAELVVTNRLSQEVGEYRHNTVQAITARTLDRHGARLHPGEAVQFIITNRKAKLPEDRVRPYTLLGTDWSYDADAYAQMLVRAGETVLELFGYSEERLWEEVWKRMRAIDSMK